MTEAHDLRFSNDLLLRMAIDARLHEAISRLLGRGCDPNAKNGEPLRLAATNGDLVATEMLIRSGANPGLFDGSALMGAVRGGHIEVAHRLVASGAHPFVMEVVEDLAREGDRHALYMLDTALTRWQESSLEGNVYPPDLSVDPGVNRGSHGCALPYGPGM